MTSLRTLLLVIVSVSANVAAQAAPIVVKGQIGFIGEWALQADLAPSQPDKAASDQVYVGPLHLRHIGKCSANGVEEKSGYASAPVHQGVASGLTLEFGGESCVFEGQLPLSTKVTRGAVRCHTGLVPISLWAAP